MFTGLIQGIAHLKNIQQLSNACDLQICVPIFNSPVELGESIAIDGCCLTVTHIDQQKLTFQAGAETLSKTILGNYKIGQRINFERALRLSDRLGGHLVSGHIDGVGQVIQREQTGEWINFLFKISSEHMLQVASKGSIAINGVSLTVVDVDADTFSVALIPHTLAETNLGDLTVGSCVNFETDMLAKYVQRLIRS